MNQNSDRRKQEQRGEERYSCVGTVVLYAPIDTDDESGVHQDLHQALMQDMSLNGLSFEVSDPVEVGQMLLVVVRPAHGGGEEHLTAEVRWCQKTAPARYRVGVRIEVSEFLAALPCTDATAAARDPSGSIVGVLTSYRQALASDEVSRSE
jgi:hypothetical protein